MPPRLSFFVFFFFENEKDEREDRTGNDGGRDGAIIHVITQYCQYASAVDQCLHACVCIVHTKIISCPCARARARIRSQREE